MQNYNDLNFQAQDSAFTADNNTLYLNSNNELTWKNNSGTEQNLTSPPGIFDTIDVNTIDDKDNTGITITSDVTIQGDLTVGTWHATTITDTDITDNIIVLNKGETGAGVTVTGNRSGIEIDRGTANNASLVFDDSNQIFYQHHLNNHGQHENQKRHPMHRLVFLVSLLVSVLYLYAQVFEYHPSLRYVSHDLYKTSL